MAGEGSQHQEAVSVVLTNPQGGDPLDLGVFRTFEGGGITGDAGVARAGAMAPGQPTPGPSEYDDVTMTRVMRHGVDSGLVQKIMARYGDNVRATRQHLDARGSAGVHEPTVYLGVLTGASESDYDADGNDTKTISMTFKPGTVS